LIGDAKAASAITCITRSSHPAQNLKLRYLVRLYAKELVMHNFVGLPADQLLERMVELSLRTEEHL